MDYMEIELCPGMGQLIVDMAEATGMDLGHVLGLLVAEGLAVHGKFSKNHEWLLLAARQYAFSCRLSGTSPKLAQLYVDARPQ